MRAHNQPSCPRMARAEGMKNVVTARQNVAIAHRQQFPFAARAEAEASSQAQRMQRS